MFEVAANQAGVRCDHGVIVHEMTDRIGAAADDIRIADVGIVRMRRASAYGIGDGRVEIAAQ